jgi:hypothetical protein
MIVQLPLKRVKSANTVSATTDLWLTVSRNYVPMVLGKAKMDRSIEVSVQEVSQEVDGVRYMQCFPRSL